ncbi:MAG: HAMP domain-containing histidine kinase [Clostridiales bacterium]|nr:HAMP domain-containing histidine kinase [Clostridiales bacterium]
MTDYIAKIINKISLPIIILYTSFYLFDKNNVILSISLETYCAVIVLALSIIIYLIKGDYIDGLYRNIGVSYIILAVFIFSNIFLFQMNNTPLINSLILQNNISKNIFIYLIIIIAFILERENASKYKALFVYLLTSIIVILFGFLFLKELSQFNFTYTLIMTIFRVWAACVIYNGETISKKEKVLFLVYISVTSIYQDIGIYNSFSNITNNIFYFILEYISYYIMYYLMYEFYFYNSYVKQKKLLQDIQVLQKDMNKVLLAKNKNLQEFQKISEKVEKSRRELVETIKDGIIMITADRITYINNTNVNMFGIKDSNKLIGESIYVAIDLLIKEYSNLSFLKERYKKLSTMNVSEKELYHVISVVHDGKEYEIYYVKLTESNSLIYTKDVSVIKENHRLTMEYDEYLKEEKVKNQFYSNISHELRTPINTISSALQINKIYLKDKNSESLLKNQGIIKQNSLRLIRTINNFIDANKVSEGYLVPNFKLCNIVSVVENASLACKTYIESIDNTLTFDSEEEEIYCYVDIDMIERVILNIISNYVKYGKPSGKLFINISKNEEIVKIELKNNLYTISEEDLPFLFDKFTKLNKALNRQREGSGLGLFLSRSLLELNEGQIKVESSKENGTNFIITLNVAEVSDYYDIDYIYDEESIKQKVAIEFSDIYL